MALAWIAVDWGTTNLRAWAVAADRGVLAEARSSQGMNALAPAEFEPALLELIGDWLPGDGKTLVLICGMAGARQGWVEASYVQIPAAPLTAAHFQAAPARDPRLAVHILPGMAQSSPADVMRGEETQIAGLLAERPGFEGTLCLPGTHSKWVSLRDGQVQGFRTHLTGEVFSLLEQRSILRHSMQAPGFDLDEFRAAVAEAVANPDLSLANLFAIRAEDLTQGLAPAAARARLSAALIGLEICAEISNRPCEPVTLVASGEIAALYETALAAAGVETETVDGAVLSLRGLAAAREMMGETGIA